MTLSAMAPLVSKYCGVEQRLAHGVHIPSVMGSSPIPATINILSACTKRSQVRVKCEGGGA